MASSGAIAQKSGALGGPAQPASPPWRNYGFVVESVNVSVLLYVPVRSASLAPMA